MQPCLLIVSPRETWPELLQSRTGRGGHAGQGDLAIHRVRTCHEAAAAVAGKTDAYVGILIDSDWLSVRELDMMNVIQRHTALPIWTLPASLHPKPVGELENLPWETAAQALAQRVPTVATPEVGRSSNKNDKIGQPDTKTPDNQATKTPEIPLASQVAAGYDGLETPVLSRSEIAALLGMDE